MPGAWDPAADWRYNALDATYGRPYWHNVRTGQKSFDKPAEVERAQRAAVAAGATPSSHSGAAGAAHGHSAAAGMSSGAHTHTGAVAAMSSHSSSADPSAVRQRESAAGTVQRHWRGGGDRRDVRDRVAREQYKTKDERAEALLPNQHGLNPYAETHRSPPHVSDDVRYAVRDATVKRVLQGFELMPAGSKPFDVTVDFEAGVYDLFRRLSKEGMRCLSDSTQKQLNWARLFVDSGPAGFQSVAAKMSDRYLLGAFDVMAVLMAADHDAFFQELKVRTGWFWVFHAAAPNIGESSRADDFEAFSTVESLGNAPPPPATATASSVQACWKTPEGSGRCLDEELYVRVMGQLWRNTLFAMGHVGVEDAIFFPFGMGAFLRHLGTNDPRYKDVSAMRLLRRRVAGELMKAISSICTSSGKSSNKKVQNGPARVHLCLLCADAESVDNHNAFIEAASECVRHNPEIKDVLQIRCNTDVLQLASTLVGSRTDLKVGILNGANRKLLGNHWFSNSARNAIDENLHRRSFSMCSMSLLLNGGIRPVKRETQDLADAVRWFGGKVVSTADGSEVRGSPTNWAPQVPEQIDSSKREDVVERHRDTTKMKSIFKQADVNGDGYITLAELGSLLRILGGFEGQDLAQVLQVVDKNRDGKVSYDEFVDWLMGGSGNPAGAAGSDASRRVEPTGPALDFLKKLDIVHWNVLGVRRNSSRNEEQAAPIPDQSTAVLDSSDLYNLTTVGPAAARGASAVMYRWLAIDRQPTFPLAVRSIARDREAKFQTYPPGKHVVHVAAPDLRADKPRNQRAMESTYESVLNEFAQNCLQNKIQKLRLTPLGSTAGGGSELAAMTMMALGNAFRLLDDDRRRIVLQAKSREFCLYSDAEYQCFKGVLKL